MSPLGDQRMTRRCLLGRALRGGASFAVLGSLPLLESCARNDAPPRPGVEYDRLVTERRVIVMDGELPVELVIRDGEIRARSLVCTHQGCTVEWDAQAKRYLCPCHEGVFDADGHPLLGPPETSLREFPVQREADFVYVDTGESREKP